MRNKDKKNTLKVGIFIGALTFVLMILIVSIGKENSVFKPKVDIKARLYNVSNLKTGSYVELRGIRIGNVSDIEIYNDDEVEVTLTILKSHLQWIRKDSRVAVSTAGLVGDKFLEIVNGTKSASVFNPEKDVLISESTTDIKQIITKGESIATVTDRILEKLDNFLTKIEDGKKIVDTIDALNKSSQNLEAITSDLRSAHLGKAVHNVTKGMKKLEHVSSSLDRVIARIEKGPGTVNSLIYDDGLYEDLRALLGGASRNKVIKYYIRESIENSERKKSQPND